LGKDTHLHGNRFKGLTLRFDFHHLQWLLCWPLFTFEIALT
jgi:hypothetical protein